MDLTAKEQRAVNWHNVQDGIGLPNFWNFGFKIDGASPSLKLILCCGVFRSLQRKVHISSRGTYTEALYLFMSSNEGCLAC
jgi:hypothetical protein